MTTDRPVPPQQRPRRPLLMDPAGAAQSDFAPPAPHQPAQPPVDPPRTPSVLAAPAPAPAPAARGSADSAFGPVSEVVRLSVRSTTARVDVVLPDRCTIAETLEAVLELSPPALRELAVAHGGWTLRGGDGRVLPSGATLVDLGVTDGSTLLLLGLDTAGSRRCTTTSPRPSPTRSRAMRRRGPTAPGRAVALRRGGAVRGRRSGGPAARRAAVGCGGAHPGRGDAWPPRWPPGCSPGARATTARHWPSG